MFCKLCAKYMKVARNGSGKWVVAGCTAFRHDKVLAHEKSLMHKDAERAREEHQAECTGGLLAAFQESYRSEKKAIIGALKCIFSHQE